MVGVRGGVVFLMVYGMVGCGMMRIVMGVMMMLRVVRSGMVFRFMAHFGAIGRSGAMVCFMAESGFHLGFFAGMVCSCVAFDLVHHRFYLFLHVGFA